MSTGEKQYGLVEAKTGKKLTVSDVFNNDSDSGGENGGNRLKKSIQQKEDRGLKKQTKLEMQRALQQDPTVYQYDEIYDDMNQKKQELEQAKVDPEKKPKYIQNLMKTAEKRKKENERRLERQIQKEREAEGDMFKDKEEFITSSYKQKLEEFKKAEEEEKKMEYIESVMDVSKQQDLGGFYRHLYMETMKGENATEMDELVGIESANGNIASSGSNATTNQGQDVTKQERNYRKRNSLDSGEEEKKEKEDSSSSSSDSDSSSDSSSSSSSSEDEKSKEKDPVVKPSEAKLTLPEEVEAVIDKDEAKEKSASKVVNSSKEVTKPESKDDRSKNGSKTSKVNDRDRRDRNYRSSGHDRDRRTQTRTRDNRNYDDRSRERDRRGDSNMRDRRDDRRGRRRSRTPESRRERNKSRDRSYERSRSRRGYERGRDGHESKSNDEERKKETRETKKEQVNEAKETKKEAEEEEPKVNIWEKRTVGAVFEAALERYKIRKAARGC